MRNLLVSLCLLIPAVAQADGLDDYLGDTRPLAGRDTVKPMKPDWCAGYKPHSDEPVDRLVKAYGRSLEKRDYGERELVMIAQAACERPDDATMQRFVASWRQRWINRTGLTEGQDRAAQKVWVHAARPFGDTDEKRAELCDAAAVNPPVGNYSTSDEMYTENRAVSRARLLRVAGGCDGTATRGGGVGFGEYWLWEDRRATPESEVARVVGVVACLDVAWGKDGWPDLAKKDALRAYALCGADARRIDAAAFEKELAGEPWTDYARVNARAFLARAGALDAHYQARIAKLDAELKKVLVDAPEAAWVAWEKDAAAWKTELDAALAYEDRHFTPGKKGKTGCGDTLRAGWTKFAASRKAATIEDAKKIAAHPIGYALLAALVACDVKDRRWHHAANQHELLTERPQRGPRTAGYYAVLDALAELDVAPLALDDFPRLVPPPLVETTANAWGNEIGYGDEDAVGEIAGLKKSGETVLVTFKTVKITYDKRECVDTNKLWGWDSSGRPIYHQSCKVVGKTTETISPDPVAVPADVAAMLKVGQLATFTVDANHDPRQGFPVEVWKDKDKKVLVGFHGTAL